MRLLIITQVVDINHPILGFFHRWIVEFAKHVEELHVIALQVGEYSLPENVTVHSLGKEDGVSKIEYIKRFYSYIWNYRNEYDSVFVHMNQEYVLLAGLFWKLLKKNIYLWYTHKHVGFRLRAAEFFVKNIFSASEESFRLKTKKLLVFGHGIDSSQFEKIKPARIERELRLLTIGRISPVKQYEVLIESVKDLCKRSIKVTLSIIGGVSGEHEKTYLHKLKNEAEGLPVVFHGNVPHSQIGLFLEHADIFLNASKTGSLDKAVLEAMAAGVVPVVSNEGLASTLCSVDKRLYVQENSFAERVEELSKLSSQDWLNMQKEAKRFVFEKHNLTSLIRRIIEKMQ